MDYVKVASSDVEKVGYDAENEELYIVFIKGGQYIYSNVSEGVYRALLKASSVGSFVSTEIKKKNYPYRKG